MMKLGSVQWISLVNNSAQRAWTILSCICEMVDNTIRQSGSNDEIEKGSTDL